MRDKEDALRSCPTCGVPLGDDTSMGLRNYQWINDVLPGREGAMDGDSIIEKRGEILMLEFKPDKAGVPMGQRLTLKAFVRKGITVWVVHDLTVDLPLHRKRVKVGRMEVDGSIPFQETMPLQGLKNRILDWRQAAIDGELS